MKTLTVFARRACWLFAIAAVTTWNQTPGPPRPGAINYIEGEASIGAGRLNPAAAGTLVLDKDAVLTTQAGKVELLLTPGVLLRLADNGTLRMISPDLANTRVELQKGRALVEVLQIRSANDIRIDQSGASTRILKPGLYDFDADHSRVRVFKGKAEVSAGNRKTTLGDHRELAIGGTKQNAQSFEPRQFEDEFYRWSALRSGYLSEASVDVARIHIGVGPGWYGPAWYGAGWYWAPGFGSYTFLPADGIFWGPFGWGFYSPIAVYYSPFRFYPGYPHRFGEYHYPYGHGVGAPFGGRGFGRR